MDGTSLGGIVVPEESIIGKTSFASCVAAPSPMAIPEASILGFIETVGDATALEILAILFIRVGALGL